MSFTTDELQAFSSILAQQLSVHRQEIDQILDHRFQAFRQEIDQRLVMLSHDILDNLPPQGFAQPAQEVQASIDLDAYHQRLASSLQQEIQQHQRQIETEVEQMLTAHIQGMEQLLARQTSGTSVVAGQQDAPQLETIEIQTELPWEDLTEAMGKALDKRLTSLSNAFQHSVARLEQYLAVSLHSFRDELMQSQHINNQVFSTPLSNVSSVQEILEGIGHLERIVESLHVAMTANHALLSNRLYHHQQLPLERAHPVSLTQPAQKPAEPASLLSQAKERIASGLEPGLLKQPDESTKTPEQ